MAALLAGVRLGIIAAFTAVEAAALAGWLGFVRGAPTVSTAVAIGVGVLLVGLFVEHVLTDVVVNGVNIDLPYGSIVLFTVTETVLWVGWLAAAEAIGGVIGVGIAGVGLALLLVPQHTIEDNVLQGTSVRGRLIDLNTVGFSVVEAIGATAWFALVVRPDLVGSVAPGFDAAVVGLAALVVALFVEHTLGVRHATR